MRTNLSEEALRQMFSPEATDTFIILVTIESTSETVYLANGHTERLDETPSEILYGVISRGVQYIYLPMSVTLPTEEREAPPRAVLRINDVTSLIMPMIRSLTNPPTITLELVLRSAPDDVEIVLPGFKMNQVPYDENTVTAELTVETLTYEPFPAHTMTPSTFPGLF